MAKILIIEDNPDLAASIELALRSQNHIVEVSPDGEDGLHRIQTYSYDLIICDWNLPGMSGIDIIKQARTTDFDSLILMLTARSSHSDMITGLESGADDYLVKPFNIRELLARVNALLRRSVPADENKQLSHGPIVFNTGTLSVTKNGIPLKLSKKELHLLSLLMSNPDRVFSFEQLLSTVWKNEATASEETVRTHIKTLRRKLQDEGQPEIITNVHGQGYRLSTI